MHFGNLDSLLFLTPYYSISHNLNFDHYWIGVFVPYIEYLLVIATPLEISLLGVGFEGKGNQKKITLHRTQMTISSDNVTMTAVVGTEKGRIFMCGNNGHLYELQYQVCFDRPRSFPVFSPSSSLQIKKRYNIHSLINFLFFVDISSLFDL